jgi:hypothetical protein
MRIEFDPTRPQTADDRQALLLISEGFRRLRAAKVSNAGTGAPGLVDLVPTGHASDPATEPMKEPK